MIGLDESFSAAVKAIDAGAVDELEHLLDDHPRLACERLDQPGQWLRDQVGDALDGFFQRPYLLWFVAEDPDRNGKLPGNIGDAARAIVRAARATCPECLAEQLKYALDLVAWSGVAARCGVQLELIDVLMEAGAPADGAPENALVNGHVVAAEHLIERGAPLSLATALCLGRWDDADRLAESAGGRGRQFALTLSALRGKAEALRRLIAWGVDVDAVSPDLYSHATPLHHAVYSGSLEAVEVLVEAGARLDARDTAYQATPLGWAEESRGKPKYDEIADYLRRHAP